jgi:hypothetical protein
MVRFTFFFFHHSYFYLFLPLDMAGEKSIVTRNLNRIYQPDDQSSFKNVFMAPLTRSTSTSSNNVERVPSSQVQ